jgi:hypothetical protein
MYGDWPERLANFLSHLSAHSSDCDLLIDFESRVHDSPNLLEADLCAVLAKLPTARLWRSLVVAATAIPAALPFDQFWPHGAVARLEITNYLRTAAHPSASSFRWNFSDYAVQHPNAEMVDPRLVGRALTLVYATADDWTIFPAPGPDAVGIRHVAREWKSIKDAQPLSLGGGGECWADEQLEWLCDSRIDVDALLAWTQIATNRHISVTARQMRRAFLSNERTVSPFTPNGKLSCSGARLTGGA